jgi:hypothetical protein
VVLFALVACSDEDEGVDAAGPDSQEALVYLSGLDDHLYPVRETVPLHNEPDGPIVGHAPVDVLAWVRGEAGEWLEVAHAVDESDGEPWQGWVADFYLRGELHAVDPDAPGCPVLAWHAPARSPEDPQHYLAPSTLVQPLDLNEDLVQVRSRATDEIFWIDRQALSERPGPDTRRAPPGTDCKAVTDDPVTPHNH